MSSKQKQQAARRGLALSQSAPPRRRDGQIGKSKSTFFFSNRCDRSCGACDSDGVRGERGEEGRKKKGELTAVGEKKRNADYRDVK